MDPDEQALQYARAYAMRGVAASPQPAQAAVAMPRVPDSGRTVRTFMVVAGIVVVAWMWFRSRRGSSTVGR